MIHLRVSQYSCDQADTIHKLRGWGATYNIRICQKVYKNTYFLWSFYIETLERTSTQKLNSNLQIFNQWCFNMDTAAALTSCDSPSWSSHAWCISENPPCATATTSVFFTFIDKSTTWEGHWIEGEKLDPMFVDCMDNGGKVICLDDDDGWISALHDFGGGMGRGRLKVTSCLVGLPASATAVLAAGADEVLDDDGRVGKVNRATWTGEGGLLIAPRPRLRRGIESPSRRPMTEILFASGEHTTRGSSIDLLLNHSKSGGPRSGCMQMIEWVKPTLILRRCYLFATYETDINSLFEL